MIRTKHYESIQWQPLAVNQQRGTSKKEAPDAGRSTSVQQIFHLEILLIQVWGGYLFDWPNRKLAILYRLLAPLAMRSILRLIISLEDGAKLLEPLLASVPRLYVEIQALLEGSLSSIYSLTTIISALIEIYYHDTIKIILSKRLDRDHISGGSANSSIKFVKRLLLTFNFLCIPLARLATWETAKYAVYQWEQNSTMLSMAHDVVSQNSNLDLVVIIIRKLSDLFISALKWEMDQLYLVGLLMGPFYLHIMIISTMADMLKVTGLKRVRRIDVDGSPSERVCVKQVQTTQLLVHIRDVLIVLRETSGKGYAAFLCTLPGFMATMPSHALLDGAAGLYMLLVVMILWAIIFFILAVLGIEVTRHLHDAADKMADESQLELVKKSSRSYIEIQTRMKLADEICTIWSTDWFTPDIKWFLWACMSLFVFVAGVHQIAEKKVKRSLDPSG